MRAIVYTLKQGSAGGLADRLIGLVSTNLFSEYFGFRFFIDFKTPFKFFNVYSRHLRCAYEWDDRLANDFSRIERINLIDENFNANNVKLIESLCAEESVLIYLEANQLDISVINNVFPGMIKSGVSIRNLFHRFGLNFCNMNLEVFRSEDVAMFDEVKRTSTIGLAVRVGGSTSGWIDSRFRVPALEIIAHELEKHASSFDQIYLSSDSDLFKKSMESFFRKKYRTIAHDNPPAHLDRSAVGEENSINSIVVDHCALRQCTAGVVTAGGRFGLTAAWLSGSPEFHLLREDHRGPVL